MFCCWQVSWLKSLESYSSAFGRVNEQEGEAGSRCTAVEVIEAEAVDILFNVQLLSKLSKLSFRVLQAA